MGIRLALYVQLVFLYVHYALSQYNYNYNYNSNYNGNYNPGYYQNSMQNYGYGYPTPQSDNDVSEEEAHDDLLSVEIRSSKKGKRDKKKKDKKKSKKKPKDKDSIACESDYNSPECKSGEGGESTECKECTCQECTVPNSNQNSCCPNSCDPCAVSQPPGIAIMAYPFPYLMSPPVPPMPYPPGDITLGPDDCASDLEDNTTCSTTNSPDTTNSCTTNSHTTGNSGEGGTTESKTDHTKDNSKEVSDVPDPTDVTEGTEAIKETTEVETTTTTSTATPERLMESTSTSPIFKTSATTLSISTLFTTTTSIPTQMMERRRQPVQFEQYRYPPSHGRPFSDHYYVPPNKRDSAEMRPIFDVPNRTNNRNNNNNERDIRMIVVKDGRHHFNMVTNPPQRMLMSPHRDYVDEMASRNNFRGRYDAVPKYPRYPSRRANSHKMPKYGILPLSDKLATKLLLKLRTMKELNTKEKNTPQIRKLKDRK